MKKASHPYEVYEGTPAWRVVDRAVKALAKNGDIKEETNRKYIVGFLCEQLATANLTQSEPQPVAVQAESRRQPHAIAG